MKHHSSPFRWRHYAPDVILLCVRWYCRYQLSYRDVEEMMRECGLDVDRSTVFRWVQRYAPEINKRLRPHLKMSGTSYRVDETYIKVGKSCKYLYRTVNKEGRTIEFMLSAKRDVPAAKRFFKKMMRADHRRLPFSISVDKNAVNLVRQKNLPPEVDQDSALERLKDEITKEAGTANQNNKWVRLTTQGEEADFQVAVNAHGEHEIWDPNGRAVPNLRPALKAVSGKAAGRVLQRLVHLTKYRNVRLIDNTDPSSPPAQNLIVELGTRKPPEGGKKGLAPLVRYLGCDPGPSRSMK